MRALKGYERLKFVYKEIQQLGYLKQVNFIRW